MVPGHSGFMLYLHAFGHFDAEESHAEAYDFGYGLGE